MLTALRAVAKLVVPFQIYFCPVIRYHDTYTNPNTETASIARIANARSSVLRGSGWRGSSSMRSYPTHATNTGPAATSFFFFESTTALNPLNVLNPNTNTSPGSAKTTSSTVLNSPQRMTEYPTDRQILLPDWLKTTPFFMRSTPSLFSTDPGNHVWQLPASTTKSSTFAVLFDSAMC